MDKDARMAERKHMCVILTSDPVTIPGCPDSGSCSVKEASTGYFEDYHKLRHEGGKLWVAPKTLIQEKVKSPRIMTARGYPLIYVTYFSGRTLFPGDSRKSASCAAWVE